MFCSIARYQEVLVPRHICSLSSDPIKQPGRQRDQGFKEFEYSRHRNTDQAKGQEQQPDQGIKQECKKGQWPAKDKKNTPEQKLKHQTPALSQECEIPRGMSMLAHSALDSKASCLRRGRPHHKDTKAPSPPFFFFLTCRFDWQPATFGVQPISYWPSPSFPV